MEEGRFFSHKEIFAYNLYLQKHMTFRDYQSYQQLFNAMLDSLRFPDLIVYLRASTWTLISRIRKRGRDYEREIDKEYLAQLNFMYEKMRRGFNV